MTTEAMVAEKPKKESLMPAMPPGGGSINKRKMLRALSIYTEPAEHAASGVDNGRLFSLCSLTQRFCAG